MSTVRFVVRVSKVEPSCEDRNLVKGSLLPVSWSKIFEIKPSTILV